MDYYDDRYPSDSEQEATLKGNNFLVSAVMILKKQKKDLIEENLRLRQQLDHFQNHNAALLDLGADRLIGKSV